MATSSHSDEEYADDAATRQTSSATDDLSVTTEFAAYWQSLVAVLHDALELIALEGRLAALSAVRMLAYGIGAAILAVTSWLALIAALAVWLYRQGIALEAVLLGIGLVNALLGLGAWLLAKKLSGNLVFAATRRQIAPSSQTQQGSNER